MGARYGVYDGMIASFQQGRCERAAILPSELSLCNRFGIASGRSMSFLPSVCR